MTFLMPSDLLRDDYDECIKCLYRCQKLIRGDLSKIKSIKYPSMIRSYLCA